MNCAISLVRSLISHLTETSESTANKTFAADSCQGNPGYASFPPSRERQRVDLENFALPAFKEEFSGETLVAQVLSHPIKC